MTTTNTFVGIAESQRVSSRVLKPPGGGSSISFGDDDDFNPVKAKPAPQLEAPKNDVQDESPKVETNGTTTPPQTPKDNATATKENNPSPATNGVAVNGTAAVNGTVSNGTNGTTTSGSSTPNSSRIDTQNRLFGEVPRQDVNNHNRRVRDHHRSNIFSGDEKVTTPKAANPAGSETPEPKTPEQQQPPTQPQPQSQPRQRVPPGGFSTKLW